MVKYVVYIKQPMYVNKLMLHERVVLAQSTRYIGSEEPGFSFQALGPTQPSTELISKGSFPGDKIIGVDPSPPCSAEFEKNTSECNLRVYTNSCLAE
jgi:hypothetical protein